jgi:hypothetical protein
LLILLVVLCGQFFFCSAPVRETRPEPPAPKAAPASIREEEAGRKEASGEDLSQEDILAVVLAPENLVGLQDCLKQALRGRSEFPAEVLVDFSVGNDGAVGEVNMDDIRLQDTELHSCLRDKLQALQFRSYLGEVKNITIPFRW